MIINMTCLPDWCMLTVIEFLYHEKDYLVASNYVNLAAVVVIYLVKGLWTSPFIFHWRRWDIQNGQETE